jgi:hypothetical protein
MELKNSLSPPTLQFREETYVQLPETPMRKSASSPSVAVGAGFVFLITSHNLNLPNIMKKLLYLSTLCCFALFAGCRSSRESDQPAPETKASLASFRGTILGQEVIITEDPNEPNSYDSPVSVRLLVGQTQPEYVNHKVYIRSRGKGLISLDIPSIVYQGYGFAKIQEQFSPGPKQFNEDLPLDDLNRGLMTRYRKGFDFIFSRADWGNIGISTIGDQTGSMLEVLSSRELPPPANSGVLRVLEVTFRMNAKLYADSDQVYGEVKNAEMTLKFYYFGPPKYD